MRTLKHTCSQCDSVFSINYDPDYTEDDPQYCPFCAEMIVDIDEYTEEDDE